MAIIFTLTDAARAMGLPYPRKAYAHDAAYDMYATGYERIGAIYVNVYTLELGATVSIPAGYYGQLQLRSFMAVKGYWSSGGVIDAGYTGIIKANLFELIVTSKDFAQQGNGTTSFVQENVATHTPLFQLLVLPIATLPSVTDDGTLLLPRKQGERGGNGFGSTNR